MFTGLSGDPNEAPIHKPSLLSEFSLEPEARS